MILMASTLLTRILHTELHQFNTQELYLFLLCTVLVFTARSFSHFFLPLLDCSSVLVKYTNNVKMILFGYTV